MNLVGWSKVVKVMQIVKFITDNKKIGLTSITYDFVMLMLSPCYNNRVKDLNNGNFEQAQSMQTTIYNNTDTNINVLMKDGQKIIDGISM